MDRDGLKAKIAARIINYLGKGSLVGDKLTEDLAAMVDEHAGPARLEVTFGGNQEGEFLRWLQGAVRTGGTRAAEAALKPAEPACWVLIEGYHDSGTINAAYGPYTEAHVDWLLAGPLQYHSGCNWTKVKLSSGPEEPA